MPGQGQKRRAHLDKDVGHFTPGAKLNIDIAAFSFEPTIFADKAAYDKSQAGEKLKFAANYFIPSGSFQQSAGGMMEDGAKRPAPYGDFAGTVLGAELRGNGAGGGYWHTAVKTFDDAIVDVVMDPRTVKLDPKPGAIVSGRFWLTARLVP